jgi:G3E family GTPase
MLTPVTILTGFLGSGKTTLLNRALRDPALQRTAVVINEFGEVGLDHLLAASSDDSVVILENGCLCCTVFGDLVGTLNRLYHQREAGEVPPFDQVAIETSGLADPAPVLQAFLSEPTLAGLYRVGSVVVTVDAVNADDTLLRHDESLRQIALADHLLITKLDLVDSDASADTEEALAARLRSINPTARIARIDDPAVDVVALIGSAGPDPSADATAASAWLNFSAYEALGPAHQDETGDHSDHAHGPGGHTHRDDIASFAFIRDEPTTRYGLQLLLNALEQNLSPRLLRLKGLVCIAEDPDRPVVIQGAQHLLHNVSSLDRWPDADRRTRVVFITQGIGRIEVEEMISLLDRVARRTAAARERAR